MSKKNSKKTGNGLNTFGKILVIIYDILAVLFLGLIIYMDVLPTKYFSIAVALLIFITVILNLFLLVSKIKKKIKITAVVFATILSVIYGIGSYYLYSTVDFLKKITDSKYQYENYYVVVLDNDTYSSIKDLGTDNLGIFKSTGDTFEDAKKELLKKVKTKNTEYDDTNKIANDLLDETIDAMFISEAYKTVLDEEVEGFVNKTKVIDTISIKTENKTVVKEVKVTEESFNIYVSGIDTYGKIASVSRSDVNMIVSVNPRTHKILLTSIPRDYYVPLANKPGLKDKLTHAGIYGVDSSIQTIENLLNIDINYYVRVNFSTLISVVDVIGGITVYSDASFIPYTNTAVKIEKGNNVFNGEKALAFARERYAYKEGDRHRVQNQQDVITAIMNKILTSQTLISKYTSLLNALDGSFQTNMNMDSLTSLIKKQIDKMPGWQFENQSVNGTDSSNVTYSYPNQQLYVMEPDMNTVKEASAKIKAFLAEK